VVYQRKKNLKCITAEVRLDHTGSYSATTQSLRWTCRQDTRFLNCLS